MKDILSNIDKSEIKQFYRTVSKNIKNARLSAGISQMDLALKIGIKSVAFYSNCENMKYEKHFNLEHIYKIAKELDVPIINFFKPLDEN